MKNKKILSRVLALSAAFILVVALAVPCFADTPENVPDGALDAFYNNWGASNISGINLRERLGDGIFDYSAVSLSRLRPDVLIRAINFSPSTVLQLDYIIVTPIPDTVLNGNEVEIWYDVTGDASLFISFKNSAMGDLDLIYSFDYDNYGFVLNTVRYGSSNYTGNSITNFIVFIGFTGSATLMNDLSFVLGGTQDSVAYPAEFLQGYTSNTGSGSAPVEPTRSGMFGQLYYTLRDAIFGEDVVLDGTQDFVLTQMVTWLTYAVALLPVIVCVCFCFKCFRW